MFALILAAVVSNGVTGFAQESTPTPGVINLQPLQPPTVDPNQGGLPSPTPMPTQTSLVRIEAKDFANIRLEPDTSAPQIGTIREGETFTVLARHISWIQFQYPSSPNGRGWVYGELVTVTGGDILSVPEIVDPYGDFEIELTQQAQGPASAGQATLAQLVQTPGSVLTMTVQAPILPGGSEADTSGLPGTPMPTYTYPPNLIAMAPTQADLLSNPGGTSQPGSTSTPPIVPIVVLGGIGVVGLLIGSLRRGG